MHQRCLVYGLKDPRTDEIRYIGQSSWGLRRPKQHKYVRPGKGSYKSNWIKNLQAAGLTFEIVILEEVSTAEDLNALECFWIAQARGLGWRLTNQTKGGEGTRGWSPGAEQREKTSRRLKGSKQSEIHKARRSLAMKGFTRTVEQQQTVTKAVRASLAKPFSDQFGRVYQNQSELAAILGISCAAVNNVLRGKASNTKGLLLKYV